MQIAGDVFVGTALASAVYEVLAMVFGRFPTITSMALRWRKRPMILLVAIPWLGLGWHLFLEGNH